MRQGRVLVAGATGRLGGVIARQLIAAEVPIRALGRNREKLTALERAGAETAVVDLLDVARLSAACQDVDQIVSTANNFLGTGPRSPGRIDLGAHQNLCVAARNARVRRLVYVSFRGASPGEANAFFRLKWSSKTPFGAAAFHMWCYVRAPSWTSGSTRSWPTASARRAGL